MPVRPDFLPIVQVPFQMNGGCAARVAAANGLLNRSHGKATQIIEAKVNVYDSLGLAEKQALLTALDALADDEAADANDEATRH